MQITSKAKRRSSHGEIHRSQRAGWLRAAVLGADDAIVSTASLMIGVAASAASKDAILISGVAGLVAGSMSMAVGEFVSVSSQRDAERADIELEKRELEGQPRAELDELTMIYVQRGLDKQLARRVAEQLSARDRLGAHLRDELGIDPQALARPIQAAWISALSFASFATVPIAALLASPVNLRMQAIAALSLVSLGVLGAIGARLGGAPMARAAVRVCLGGSLAMGITAAIGKLLGVSIG
ncbi:MAG TPA: VIT family protein [Polyangiaceae bacterium]|nr:VIT family protein [Polyangiaceae bacterium]